MAIVDRGRLVDGITALDGGMDSGRSPSVIAPNQCAYAGNVAFRGGFAKTRPAFRRINITGGSTFIGDKFQGCSYFDYSDGQIVAIAGGNIYKFEPPTVGSNWACTDITDSKTVSATRERVHFCQVENKITSGSSTSHLVIQDGSALPRLWDGSSMTAAVSGEVPIGTGPMAFGHGRLWVAKGRSYVAGDIYGGTNGTLSFSENTYLDGGGAFSVPVSAGNITAMRFAAAPNTALGQGELIVATDDAVFTVSVPLDRSTWADLTDPIQRVALINNGAMSHHSTELVNGDIFMRSRDGIRSVIQAVRDFNQLGNTPISSELYRVFKYDDAKYLQHSSGVLFDNRYLLTSQSEFDATKGIAFNGIVALDFNQISSMKGKAPPSYDGFWRLDVTRDSVDYHHQVYQMVKGRFQGVERCFAFVRPRYTSGGSVTYGDTELWELTVDSSTSVEDIDVASDGSLTENKITSEIETPSFDFSQIGAAKTLESADLWVDELTGGTVTFHADFHPDQYPCWVSWQDWSVIAEGGSPPQPENETLSGTGTVADESDQLTGTGTSFTTELEVGDVITVGGSRFSVDEIVSDTSIELATASTSAITDGAIVRVSSSCNDLIDAKVQYRPRMRIGTPSSAEEPAVGKPFNYGWEFAARLKWTGHARVKLFRLNARETQEEPYADVNIDGTTKAIACDCLGGVSSATNQ